MNNPFTAAQKVEKKLKVLVYGESGAGKTWFALTFPGKVAVVDTEGGTELYGGREDVQNFDVIRTKSFADVERAIEFIEQDAGKTYQTLVIDPITVIWQVLQDAAMKKYGTKAGTISYQGWGKIKGEYNRIFTRLANLPIHVVVTARAKTDYEESGGSLTRVGVKPDAEKGTAYIFDIILRLENNGTRYAVVEKDRSGQLPGKIENAGYKDLAPIAEAHTTGEKVVQQDVDQYINDTAEALPEMNENQPPAPKATPSDTDTVVAYILDQIGRHPGMGLPAYHATIGGLFSSDYERQAVQLRVFGKFHSSEMADVERAALAAYLTDSRMTKEKARQAIEKLASDIEEDDLIGLDDAA